MPRMLMDPANQTILRETPHEALRTFITPTFKHFTLSALGIPRPRPGEWALTIEGAVAEPRRFSLHDIQKLPARTLIVTLECAGDPLQPDKPVRRVSTAKWRGVPLVDFLNFARPLAGSTHVWIDGADWGVYRLNSPVAERVSEYRKDLTLERASRGDVLLAYEMNDEALLPEHGYPLRLVVPGYYGTNSVKWVNNIIVANGRPGGLFSSILYNSADIVDGAIERRQVADVKVNSLITSHRSGDVVSRDNHRITGWAWGAHEIVSVAVRIGRNGRWSEAQVNSRIDYAWQSFELAWRPFEIGKHIISVRATDSAGHTQPDTVHINQVTEVDVEVT